MARLPGVKHSAWASMGVCMWALATDPSHRSSEAAVVIAHHALPLVVSVVVDQAQQKFASPEPRELQDASHERQLRPVPWMPGEVEVGVPLQDVVEEVATHAEVEGLVHLAQGSRQTPVSALGA